MSEDLRGMLMVQTPDLLMGERMAGKRKASRNETLGQRIARLRKARGLTQTELAKVLGLGQPNISDYERDEARPYPMTIVKMAEVLDVTTDEILGHRVKSRAAPAVSRKLMRRVVEIEKLPKSDRQALLKTIDAFLSKSA